MLLASAPAITFRSRTFRGTVAEEHDFPKLNFLRTLGPVPQIISITRTTPTLFSRKSFGDARPDLTMLRVSSSLCWPQPRRIGSGLPLFMSRGQTSALPLHSFAIFRLCGSAVIIAHFGSLSVMPRKATSRKVSSVLGRQCISTSEALP